MKKSDIDIDWAVVVDLFASQYGWTIEYISSLNLAQVVSLLKQIKKRCSSEGNPNIPDIGDISKEQEEMSLSDFETKLGGKKVTENGVTKIVI